MSMRARISIIGVVVLIFVSLIKIRCDLPNISTLWYPDRLAQLVIASEDRRFYSHIWVDIIWVIRAAVSNISAWKITQWWSTIPQQLLKHYRWHTRRTRSNKRYESVWAILLTIRYTKSDIVGYYLDHVPFPASVWYSSACQLYFDKSCNQLFDSELIFLIAIAKEGSNPYSNFDQIRSIASNICETTNTTCIGMDTISLKPRTQTIDPRTRLALMDYPSTMRDTWLYTKIDTLISSNYGLLKQHGANDCCIIIIGTWWQIISYNQCRNYHDRLWTIDMCRTRRQTWSAIKPWIYDRAMRQYGYTSGSLILDAPVSYTMADWSAYEPKNFDSAYHGTVTLAQALWNSFNIPAIKLTHLLWVSVVIDMINDMRLRYGQNTWVLASEISVFTPQKLWLSVGLGTYEMSVLEFVRLWWYRYDTPNQIMPILSNPLNRVVSFGQDNFLNRKNRFVKTWTSRKFVDGWACGWRMDRETIICVRVGNADISSMNSASVDTAWYLRYLATQLIDTHI